LKSHNGIPPDEGQPARYGDAWTPDIKTTLIYTQLVSFEGDEYHVKASRTLEEDEELLKAGFEHVTERDGVKIYRKRKLEVPEMHSRSLKAAFWAFIWTTEFAAFRASSNIDFSTVRARKLGCLHFWCDYSVT
jgi:hypothetical protein